MVTEADILAGKVVNVATATGTSPDPDEPDVPVTPGEDPEPTEDPKGHITITKVTTSKPANGEAYVLGEKITYKITVTNDGNLTITNIKVTDALTGDTWTIASLAPGASEEFTAEHVVTEADILAGKVVNVATATGDSPDPDEPDVPVTPGEDPEPTEEKNAKLTVTKETTSTPTDSAYVLDDTITYKVTVKNEGNVTLTNIVVKDELTGDEWTIASLAPGASQEFTATYTVTVDDVVAGSVKNVAAATAVDPENKPVAAQDEVEDPTKKKDGNDVDPEPGDDDETMDADGKSITVVYDGKAHTLTATATVAGSTIWYSTDGGATWTTTPPSRTDVGTTTYSIKATHPAYEDVVKDGYTLTVIPRDLTITIDDKTKVYGTEDPEFTYSIEGLVEGETIPAELITIWRDEGEDVGTYTIHGKIGPKSLILNAFERMNSGIRLGAMAKGARSTFDVKNYNVIINEGTLKITPATVTVKADDATKVQGTKDPTFTATVTGLVNGDDESVITYTLTREPGEKPGTYTITPSGEEVQGNYIVVFETGTLTIKNGGGDDEVPLGIIGYFSLYFMSDTMIEAEGARADAFKSMVDWAAETAERLSAIAMVGSGNVVAKYDDADAWKFAKDTLNTLDKLPDSLPYFYAAGSSDVNGDEMNYDAYFANDLNKAAKSNRFFNVHDRGSGRLDQGDEDGQIWYNAFEEQQLLLIGIGYQKIAETEEEQERQEQWLNFVKEAIASRPEYGVVLVLNDYIDENGELTEFGKLIE